MSIQKHWVYKVYDSTGDIYRGILKNVQSDFVLTLDINSAGPAPITIRVAQTGEVADEEVEYIVTEDDDYITTEDGLKLTTDGTLSNYGISGSQIKNGNIVKIYEISDYYPNGKLVYTGRVKRWTVVYGASDEMKLYVKPLSLDVNNHLVKGPEVLGTSQTSQDSSFALYGGSAAGGRKIGYLYFFTLASQPNIATVKLRVAAQSATPVDVTVRLHKLPGTGSSSEFQAIMNDPANAINTATVNISSTTPAEYSFTFTVPTQLVEDGGGEGAYGIAVDATGSSGTGALVYWNTGNVDGAGFFWTNDSTGWSGGAGGSGSFQSDLYFKAYYIPLLTKITLTDFVASTMLKTILNNYASDGGVVSYDSADIGNTGESIPAYTFSVNTVLEGINTMLDFAPRNWYYTIDPGTNMLTFKEANTTNPDHMLTFKKEIQELEFTASIENVKNKVYFTGGDTGSGTNLFLLVENTLSEDEFGTEIDRITDIRLTNTAAGTSKANKHLDKNDDESYETPIQIPDNTMDITLFKPGQTIGFQGFDSVVDSAVLTIVRIERHRDYINMELGIIPYRESYQIAALEDQLLGIQTIANPTSPS